jgi:uncharacterized integral membrane protein (TIGR00698 family)
MAGRDAGGAVRVLTARWVFPVGEGKSGGSGLLKYAPGLLLLCLIAAPALFLQHQITVSGKTVVSGVAIAIVLGILIRNLIGLPAACKAGATFAVKRLLRIGIALMGAQLGLAQVLRTGGRSVLIVAICIVLAILVVRGISMRMGMSDRLGTLIGVGTSICGVSAIVATAPAIEAREEETSLAVATITVFGLLAVLLYPFLGHLLGLSDVFFGTWAGTAVNDTSQVVATGLIYSQRAGEVATVVKLTRNLFMAPVIVLLSSVYLARAREQGAAAGRRGMSWRNAVPGFVLGFVGLAVLNSLGVLPPAILDLLKTASGFLIVVALAGVGLETNLAALRAIGLRPFYAGLCAATFMAVISFSLIRLFGIG